MARKKNQRRGRTSQQNIDRSGREIYEQGGQITVLTENRCDVKSQSREGVTYRVSYGCGKFTCECHYHTTGKGCRCKHIAAVEYMLLREAESPRSGDAVIGEAELACTECGSKEYVENGHDTRCKSGRKQRYRCKECRRRFRDNLGFGRRHTAPAFITLALMLNGMGMPPFRIWWGPRQRETDQRCTLQRQEAGRRMTATNSEAAITHKGAMPRKTAASISTFTVNGARPLVAAQGQCLSGALLTARPRSDVGFTSFSHTST